MMNTYKIKIKPVDSFYFGSEKKFNPAEKGETNYLVESLKTPQQTTILGMLRYALLAGSIRTKGAMCNEELIGEHSFDAESTQYGVIRRLSPIFFEKEGNSYIEAGVNNQLYIHEETKEKIPVRLTLSSVSGISNTSQKNKERIYYYSNFDHKQPFGHYLTPVAGEGPATLVSYDDILSPCYQPGNRKERDGKSNQNGFYKQTKYRMKPGWSFGVCIQSDEELSGGIFYATLGGDQSLFEVSIHKEENSLFFLENPEPQEKTGIVTLISDAYLNDLSGSYFSVLEMVDFRYLNTRLKETTDYASMSSRIYSSENANISMKKPQISRHIRLVSKGSVFYCHNVKEFVSRLDDPGYQTIGYNHYTIIY